MKIVAIDFETANYSPLSACAIGLAIFEDQELIESPYWLIKPPKGHGWFIEEWTSGLVEPKTDTNRQSAIPIFYGQFVRSRKRHNLPFVAANYAQNAG